MNCSPTDFRRMAAAIDLRMRQLDAQGVRGHEIIDRMVVHLPDLQRIWEGASDAQLLALCEEFTGFYRYASLMEDAAEAERNKPDGWYDDFPELPGALKESLRALLTEAAALESGYQSIIDAANPALPGAHIARLDTLHTKWMGAHDSFLREVRSSADIPGKALAVMTDGFARIANRIERVRAIAAQ